jgi:hypothetical protein
VLPAVQLVWGFNGIAKAAIAVERFKISVHSLSAAGCGWSAEVTQLHPASHHSLTILKEERGRNIPSSL